MTPVTQIRGFMPFTAIVLLQAAVALGHSTVIYTAISRGYTGQHPLVLTALANALVILPMVLMFSPAGYFTDRLPKSLVMRWASLAGLIASVLIAGSYYLGWFWGAFALTLLLSIQNVFFSPAKYSHIRELVDNAGLSRANSVIQAASVIGLLAGALLLSTFCATWLSGTSELNSDQVLLAIAPTGWILVALSGVAWLLSFRLVEHREAASDARFDAREYLKLRYLRQNLKLLRQQRSIRSAVVGLATFWTIAQIILIAMPALVRQLPISASGMNGPGVLVYSCLGLASGALLAGRISRNHLEIGLIPFSALGIALLLALAPSLESVPSLAVALVATSFLGGLFVVPLNALIQFQAPPGQLGTISAGRNWFQAIGMLIGLGLGVVANMQGVDAANFFYALALVAAVGAGYCVRELPHSLTRTIARAILKRRFRLEVLGFENLPSSGAVLLLGNHTSWVDWAMVQVACPRQVRFVLQRDVANNWFMKLFFRLTGTAAISTQGEEGCNDRVTELLQQGRVVCMFPERGISGNGQLGEFLNDFENAVKSVEDGVIIPFYLRGLWGTRFSRSDEGLRDSRSPSLRRDLIVAFGKPLPLDTRAGNLKQKVFDLSITAWESYTKTLDPLPLAWLKRVKRKPGDICIVDASEVKLTRRRFGAATLAFSGAMNLDSKAENVGLLLPASNAASIANMAVILMGRAAVNLNFSASPAAVNAGIVEAGIKQVFTSRQFEARLGARGVDFSAMLAGAEIIYMEDIKEAIPQWRLILSLLQIQLLPAGMIYALKGVPATLEDPAAILFSSGSEGKPKGVVLSHRNIQSNCKQISDVLNTRVDDVVIASLPPFHAFGLTVTLIMPLIEGVPVACHPDPTDVLGIAQTVAKYRATILFGTATFLSLYARNRKVAPVMLDSLRFVVAGAEKLPEKVRQDFQLKFNKFILEGYGATETTPVASVNVPDAVDTSDWKIQVGGLKGSVGMPLPGTSFKVVDPDTRRELPLGEDGMILISGNQVMLGYLNDEVKTNEVIFEQDGMRWYVTGDKGHISPEGFLIIVDRYSRFAKIGGEMVSLGAVEEAARSVLEDDSEADLAAAAVPDAKKGEKIVMLVTSNDLESELRDRMIAAGVAPMMLPSQVIRVEEVPKLGSGKTDFSALNKLAGEVTQGA
jgi:acyl-[acyl-carrier-protein]-phospholipid O-acyltransferase/long-chain-fatty-acid--[acyl-carrier-protein] ligase